MAKFSIAYYVGTNLFGSDYSKTVCSGWLNKDGKVPEFFGIQMREPPQFPLRECLEILKDHAGSDPIEWSESPYTQWLKAKKVEPYGEGFREVTLALQLSFVTPSSGDRIARLVGAIKQ